MSKESGAIELDLPLNPGQVVSAGRFEEVAREAAGGLPVQDTLLDPHTRYLVLVLKDGLSRAHLQALAPDPARLLAAETSGTVMGVRHRNRYGSSIS